MADGEHATAPVNVYEGNGQLSVAVPIPGAHPDHVEVTVEPGAVHVRAECKYAQERQHLHRHDWQVGAWRADVELPRTVDPAQARATLHLGVLVVMAPASDAGTGSHRPRIET